MPICIEQMNYDNIEELTDLYIRIYKETYPKEKWDTCSAKKFITYFYELCPDLFF